MLHIIHAAGWPIWLLVATSVLCLALIIERMLSLRAGHVLPARLPGQALDLYRQDKDTPEAIIRLASRAPLGRVLAEVLPDTAAWQALAGLGWLVAFLPWVARIGRIYLRPRADGRPG